jgi:solute carrier family 25, member 39/40
MPCICGSSTGAHIASDAAATHSQPVYIRRPGPGADSGEKGGHTVASMLRSSTRMGGVANLRVEVTCRMPRELLLAAMAASDRGPGAAAVQRPPGMLATLRELLREEGARSLWRGVDSAMLMAVPTVLLYYPMYDVFLERLLRTTPPELGGYISSDGAASKDDGQNDVVLPRTAPLPASRSWQAATAPMVAGAAARALTMVIVAPLEYVRVQQQAGLHAGAGTPGVSQAGSRLTNHPGGGGGTWDVLRNTLQQQSLAPSAKGGAPAPLAPARMIQALPRLWTGLGATIARDVPFSAIYWCVQLDEESADTCHAASCHC